MPVSRWGSRALDFEFLRRNNWWMSVDVCEPAACWPWTKSTASHGYGNTWDGVTVRLAHRVAWALHHERQIPVGMTVDHWCHNKVCCNPAHLRLLTNVENARDNGFAARTHCPRDHAYDEDNTRFTKKGARICRTCQQQRNDARYAA